MKKNRIAIIGGGISGLTTAFYLTSLLPDVAITLWESAPILGGWIKTTGKEFLLEKGPKGCVPRGDGLFFLQLAYDLGLEKELIGADWKSKKRYICNPTHKKRTLWPLPYRLWHLLTLRYGRMVLKILGKEFRELVDFNNRGSRNVEKDISVFDFAAERYGRAIAQEIFDPMVSGIYGGGSHTLSFHSAFPLLATALCLHPSLLIGVPRALAKRKRDLKNSPAYTLSKLPSTGDSLGEKWKNIPLVSLRQGMGKLIHRLEEVLRANPNLKIHLQTPAPSFDDLNNQGFTHWVVTLGAKGLEKYLSDRLPDLATEIGRVSYRSLRLVHLVWRQGSEKIKEKGFGYLIPSHYHSPFLGAVLDSAIFPEQNKTPGEIRVTFMASLDESSDDELIEKAIVRARIDWGITQSPDYSQVTLCQEAIPHYPVGYTTLQNKWRKLLTEHYPEAYFGGTLWGGVSVNASIRKGMERAVEIAQSIREKK